MTLGPAADGWVQGDATGLPPFLQPLWTRREGEAVAFGFEARPELANARGVLHGGILATFMDHTLGLTARIGADPAPMATVQLDLHYVAAAQPGPLIEGRGEVVRRTASLVFLRGTLSAGGRLLLSASGIWKVLARR